jgi:acetoin utilization protein AcuB
MLIRDRMTSPVVTVTPDTSLEEALALMGRQSIRRLPVVDRGRVVGIITWTDLMRAQPSAATSLSRWEIPALLDKTEVQEVMTRHPRVIAPDAPLEEAAVIMRAHKIGALPVVRGDALVGIITESDIFDAFATLLGARLHSYRITVDTVDNASALPEITAVIRVLGLRLHGIATYLGAKGRLRVVLRVERAIPLPSLVSGLEEHGLKVVHAADSTREVLEVVAVPE